MNGHLEVAGELLLNHFGQTDMLGLSTRRDLHVSGIHFVWKNPEIIYFLQNMTSNFRFFESRQADRPTVCVWSPPNDSSDLPGTKRIFYGKGNVPPTTYFKENV